MFPRAKPGRTDGGILWLLKYSNVSWGKRKKEEQDDIIPCIIEEDGIAPEQRKN